ADDGTTVAHALSLPGCSAPDASPELALAGLEITLREWLSFLTATGERVPPESTELELSVDEWIATGTGTVSEPGEVCFAHDRLRLEPDEVDSGLRVLGALRGRILPHVRRVPEPELEAMGRPEWNVRVLLNELARAQWWT